jgi:hypothetical protein
MVTIRVLLEQAKAPVALMRGGGYACVLGRLTGTVFESLTWDYRAGWPVSPGVTTAL